MTLGGAPAPTNEPTLAQQLANIEAQIAEAEANLDGVKQGELEVQKKALEAKMNAPVEASPVLTQAELDARYLVKPGNKEAVVIKPIKVVESAEDQQKRLKAEEYRARMDRFEKKEFTLDDIKHCFDVKDYSTILSMARATSDFRDEGFGERFIKIKNDVLDILTQKVESARTAYKRDVESDPILQRWAPSSIKAKERKGEIYLKYSDAISDVDGVVHGASNEDEKVNEIRALLERSM